MRTIAATALLAIALVAWPDAIAEGAVAPCAPETKKLKAFRKAMAPAKRKYFRSHRAAKARKAFVKRQKATLTKLTKARARCLAKVKPPLTTLPGPGVDPTPFTPNPDPGPAPPGNTGPPATGAIHDLISPAATVAPGEVSLDGGSEVVRTQIELDLAQGATATEFQALLDRLGATVVSSLEGVGLPTVRIPDPGSLPALKALVAGIAGDPALDGADMVTLPVLETIPGNLTLGTTDTDYLRGPLAVHAGAAWNARAALTSPPTLIQADAFGDGPPSAAANVTVLDATDFSAPAASYSVADPFHSHGYLVLGQAAAAFDATAVPSVPAEKAVGSWAGPALPLRVVDLRTTIAGSTLEDRILIRVGQTAGNVLVNTSLGDGCAEDPGGCTAAELATDALQWIQRVRGSGLEGGFLQISAAGNMRFTQAPASILAARNSAVNAAALAPLPGGVSNLTNVVVVENAIASPVSNGTPVAAICRNDSSKQGGDISAIGTDVRSLGSASTGVAEADGGTSSATPQVAGIAASMWALRPGLSPQQIADRLRNTARPVSSAGGDPRCNAAATPAPVLDAYAALLSTDRPTSAPALRAVLDVANASDDAVADGTFDEHDLTGFADAFDAAAGAVDYGRYDLNGDGRTGGTATDQLDLDRTDPGVLGTTHQAVAGLDVTYDETALTDIDVLCHAAHGTLYQGDVPTRDQFAEERCLPPITLDVTFPDWATAGQNAALQVTARRTDTLDTQADVPIALTVTGGTASPIAGFTDASGTFDSQAQLAAGAPQIDIDIEAKIGSTVLASATVTATAETSVRVIDRKANVSAGTEACTNPSNCLMDNDSHSAPTGSGTMSFSAGAAATSSQSDAVNSSSASASGSIDATLTRPSGGIDAGVTCSATGQASRSVDGNSVGASGGAGCGFEIEVEIHTASDYDISGSLGGAGTGGYFMLRRPNSTVFSQNVGDPPNGVASGTLAPGTYFFGAGRQANAGVTGFGPLTFSESGSMSVTFTVVPQ